MDTITRDQQELLPVLCVHLSVRFALQVQYAPVVQLDTGLVQQPAQLALLHALLVTQLELSVYLAKLDISLMETLAIHALP